MPSLGTGKGMKAVAAGLNPWILKEDGNAADAIIKKLHKKILKREI
ncbi:MAG: hypothetical protein CM15mP70_16720 [Pelagibacteraceae bacterium]|nr:MAG: hypothetical protein CM15mP70_16720 [Pelagibacteraceae bacterium]